LRLGSSEDSKGAVGSPARLSMLRAGLPFLSQTRSIPAVNAGTLRSGSIFLLERIRAKEPLGWLGA